VVILKTKTMQQQVMRAEDVFGLVLMVSFGLRWILFPSSVIGFYAWFHRRNVVLPKPVAVRLLGSPWVALVVVVAWVNLQR